MFFSVAVVCRECTPETAISRKIRAQAERYVKVGDCLLLVLLARMIILHFVVYAADSYTLIWRDNGDIALHVLFQLIWIGEPRILLQRWV